MTTGKHHSTAASLYTICMRPWGTRQQQQAYACVRACVCAHALMNLQSHTNLVLIVLYFVSPLKLFHHCVNANRQPPLNWPVCTSTALRGSRIDVSDPLMIGAAAVRHWWKLTDWSHTLFFSYFFLPVCVCVNVGRGGGLYLFSVR